MASSPSVISPVAAACRRERRAPNQRRPATPPTTPRPSGSTMTIRCLESSPSDSARLGPRTPITPTIEAAAARCISECEAPSTASTSIVSPE